MLTQLVNEGGLPCYRGVSQDQDQDPERDWEQTGHQRDKVPGLPHSDPDLNPDLNPDPTKQKVSDPNRRSEVFADGRSSEQQREVQVGRQSVPWTS